MGAMKLGLLAALVLAAAAGAGPGKAQAQAQAARPDGGQDRIVTLSGDYPELAGRSAEMAFVTGGQPRITAQVADDIFASGREIRVEGASADHLFLAGGEIDAAPAAAHDVIAAGGRILLRSGAVSDDVVAAAGEISLDRNARIGGSAVLAGGRLRIETPVDRELMASGGRVEVNGPVGGDARIQAREIVIGPQARIGGDLHVRGEQIEISPAAAVQGRTVREIVKPDRRPAARLRLLGALFSLGVLVMVGAIAAVAPLPADSIDRRLRSRPWVTIGIGALIVLLGPPLIMALLATVLGAPLALLLGLAYLIAIPLAFAGVSYWGGQVLRARMARARAAEPPRWQARFGWTALAGLLLTIVCVVPVIGGVIWLLALAAGIGALAAQAVPGRSEPAPRPA